MKNRKIYINFYRPEQPQKNVYIFMKPSLIRVRDLELNTKQAMQALGTFSYPPTQQKKEKTKSFWDHFKFA